VSASERTTRVQRTQVNVDENLFGGEQGSTLPKHGMEARVNGRNAIGAKRCV